MKGLRLYLPPFAPDDSGAAGVLYNLKAMTVIIDAGGCAGNILGFDEPRQTSSAVFSAGLRDMDAILGRDDNLIEKISLAVQTFSPKFIALIGTPVPAVIGTDYFALCRIIENKLNIPAIAIDTDGTKLYDDGMSKTYLTLFKKFAKKRVKKANYIGILGASHFDFSQDMLLETFNLLYGEYDKVYVYGLDKSVQPFKHAGKVVKNIVVSASGLAAAKYLKQEFDIPFEVEYRFAKDELLNLLPMINNTLSKTSPKILIIHEQFHANALRDELKKLLPKANVVVGSWFMSHKEYMEENDVCLSEEDAFIKYVKSQDFDAIFADKLFLRALPFYENEFIPLHHFAVSGSKI